MIVTSYFTERGVPKTGLTPQLTVWDLTGAVILNSVNMTEVAGGWYYYDWPAYDGSIDYVMRADGGAALLDYERYNFVSNAEDVFDRVVEGTMSYAEMFRVVYAFAANISGGGGTPVNNFRDLANGKDRISANVDANGNRLAVVVDGT